MITLMPAAAARTPGAGTVVAIVRHPHAKLLSGYLDKIVGEESSNKALNRTLPKVHRFWPPGWNPHPGGSKKEKFKSWVHAWRWNPHYNPHFSNQVRACGFEQPQGPQREFLRLEEEMTWYGELLCDLGLDHAANSGWQSQSAWWHGGASCYFPRCGCARPLRCDGSDVCSPDVYHGHNGTPALGVTPASFHATHGDLHEHYTDEAAHLVTAVVRPDLERFGYVAFVPSEHENVQLLHPLLVLPPPPPAPPSPSPPSPSPSSHPSAPPFTVPHHPPPPQTPPPPPSMPPPPPPPPRLYEGHGHLRYNPGGAWAASLPHFGLALLGLALLALLLHPLLALHRRRVKNTRVSPARAPRRLIDTTESTVLEVDVRGCHAVTTDTATDAATDATTDQASGHWATR